MTTRTPSLLAFLGWLSCVGLGACVPRDVAEPEDKHTERQLPLADRQCFRNEYPFEDDPGNVDVIELSVTLEGARVTGVYSWLPAFKDHRVGTLEGTVRDDLIAARYTFAQEGSNQSAEISITLEETRAIVKGGAPSLGLASDIRRVDCSS